MIDAWEMRSQDSAVPEGWTITRLGSLVELTNGYPFSSDLFVLNEGDVPLIRIRDLLADDFEVFVAGDVPDEAKVENGDVLIGMDGDFNVVRWNRGSAALNQRVCRLRPKAGVDVRFIAYCLPASLNIINDLTFSTTVKHLSSNQLLSEWIPIPSLDEQKRIADFLDGETMKMEDVASLRKLQHRSLTERSYAEVSEELVPGILVNPSNEFPWPWLPEMPQDRPLVRLGYVSRIQNGITVDANRAYGGHNVNRPYLRVANVQAGRLDLDSVSEISVPPEAAARSTLHSGDVLMTEGGDLDKLGRGTLWRSEIPECLHQNHIFAIRPDTDRLDGAYLSLMTQTLHGRCYFESTGSRTTNLASTNSGKIMSFPIPLPSVAKQRDLASQVQRTLDQLSSTRALLDRQLSLLSERRQSLITAAVTGQIDVTTARGADVA